MKFGEKSVKSTTQARAREKQQMIKNIFMAIGTILALLGVVEIMVRIYEFNRGLDKKYSEEMFGKNSRSKGMTNTSEVRLNPKLKKD